MTVTLPEPAVTAPAPLVLPPADDVPRKSLSELLGQLAGLGSADGIAKFFLDEGVRGEPNNSGGCPIAKWLSVETGDKYSVGSGSVVRLPPSSEDIRSWGAMLPYCAREFIRRFDNGEYKALTTGPAVKSAAQALCDCQRCHGWSNPDPFKETLAKLGHFSAVYA